MPKQRTEQQTKNDAIFLAWKTLTPEERLARWKSGEQPRFCPKLSDICDIEKLKATHPEVSSAFCSHYPRSSLIHVAYAYHNEAGDGLHSTGFNLNHRAVLPCFGDLMANNPKGEWGNIHQPVAGFMVEYSPGTIDHAIKRLSVENAAAEQVEFLMSKDSPWWPMPESVEICDRLFSFPRTMLVHDVNQPAVAMVNFLIAFRSMLFDTSNLRTYKVLREKGWGVPDAFFGTSMVQSIGNDEFAFEHRQVEFPVTGERVARSRGSFKKFIGQEPVLTPEMAFYKARGIPNNIMWECARNRKVQIFDIFPEKFGKSKDYWTGLRISGPDVDKFREFILQS